MAIFGPIASPAPNILFSPMMVDQAVQARQRNSLMMDNARQDQQQQTFQRDAEARIGMARELSALPEPEAAAQWGSYRQRLQSAGLGQGLPEQFPGLERLRAVASSDLTTFQRMQIEERRRQSEAFMAAFGGGAMPVAMPGGGAPAPGYGAPVATPPSAGAVRPDNQAAAAARERVMNDPNLTPEQRSAALEQISMGRFQQLTGTPANATFRNNAPLIDSAPAPAGAPAPAPAAAPRSTMQLDANGLTEQQRRMVVAAGPGEGTRLAAQFQQQNRAFQDRDADNARADAALAEQRRQAAEQNRRADEALRLQQENARRAEERAEKAEQDRQRAQGRLQPAEVQMVEETEDRLAGLQSARSALTEAARLSPLAYAGPLAQTRALVAGTTGYDSATATATRQFDSIMSEQALSQLRSIFGGNPTEGERRILLEIQSSASMPRETREALLRRAQEAVDVRERAARERLTALRRGTYGQRDPEYTAPAGPPPAAEPGPNTYRGTLGANRRPRVQNDAGQIMEYDGTQWVPVQ